MTSGSHRPGFPLFALFAALLLGISHGYCILVQVSVGLSIQSAIDSLASGDTIIVSPGTFQETLVLYGKDLVIAGEWLLNNDTSFITQTVIESNHWSPDTQSCIVLAYGEEYSTLIAGLTLRHGTGTRWDGPNESAGGGLYIRRSSATIRSCVIDSCTSAYGGGLALCGEEDDESGLHIEESRISSCTTSNWGGGAYSYHATFVANGVSFVENQSTRDGAGAYAIVSSADFHDCVFEGNRGGVGGLLLGDTPGIVEGCSFRNNSAYEDFRASDLQLNGATISAQRCDFSGSTPNGVSVDLCCNSGSTIDFSGNSFVGLTGRGRYILKIAGVAGVISHNLIVSTAGYPSMMYAFQGATARIHHNFIAWNQISTAILSTGPSYHCTLDSNWIEGNTGSCFYDALGPADSILAENNWWGDSSGPYHPTLNPDGLGDTLGYDLVDFIPWLTSPPDTSWTSVGPTEPHIPSTWALMNVFPNPFNSEIKIEIAGFARNGFSVKLYNLLGREVATLHLGPITGSTLNYTAPPSLASGVYILRAADKMTSTTRKIVLMK